VRQALCTLPSEAFSLLLGQRATTSSLTVPQVILEYIVTTAVFRDGAVRVQVLPSVRFLLDSNGILQRLSEILRGKADAESPRPLETIFKTGVVFLHFLEVLTEEGLNICRVEHRAG
jgi:hypothetical protein